MQIKQRILRILGWPQWQGRRLARHHFQASQLEQIAAQIEQSEQGHTGEIVVAIEAVSPQHETNTYLRALEVYGRLKVWDSPLNSGVLLYITLDRRCIELIADRGISAPPRAWQQICSQLEKQFKQGHYLPAVLQAIEQIGHLLQEHAPHLPEPEDNHLDNWPVLLH